MTAPTEPTAPAATAPTSPVTPVPTPPGLAAPAPRPGPAAPAADTDTGTDPAEGQGDSTPDPADDGGGKGGREAAGYRRRLREAEGERDALAASVERLQRADVGRHAAGRLAVADDLFAVGAVELSDLLGESGDVDPAKVEEAVAALLQSRPGLAVVPAPRMPDLGQGRREGTPGGSSWSSALRDRNGR